jgi:Trk K+ transport system NAD-binding subunit/Kef-type K+ transport system membrane component KefB/mannitol/fructose-specific phosphotransferase system IIA component (Ntr-type)
MVNYTDILIFLASFAVIALASKQIGQFFVKIHFPLISGFLFTGILTGPYVLNLISLEITENLRFVDEISLAVIAFAAGSELYIKDLRSRFKSIRWVTLGLVVCTFTIGSFAVFFLSGYIPFMQAMPVAGRIAVSLLAGAILVARSPSSAIAIVNELRAKGPFTQMVLGVTVIMDVVVITLFAANSSIADALMTGLNFNLNFIFLLLAELLAALALGYLLAKTLQFILYIDFGLKIKTVLVLLAGYGVYILSSLIHKASLARFSFEIHLEPLLICMIGSFLVTNYTRYRMEFSKILRDVGPPIYIAFFTLTGASLSLDILAQTWKIALVLFFVRCGAIFIGSFSGGVLAGDPMNYNRASWMSFITQAGVGLGLAKAVAVEFPQWGASFATVIIAVIVLNQIIGPPLFKKSIRLIGEDHSRAEPAEFDGIRDAIIFGLEGQSLALARLLKSHGWEVKIACQKVRQEDLVDSDLDIYPVSDFTLEVLRKLKTGKAEAVVAMLSDEENYQICELVYEHFGTENMIVRLNNRVNFERFHALGALIVDPTTAIVSLLDHFVRSPSAASLLLGMEENQDVVELEVRNPNLHGLALHDLRLPLDTIVLSVRRHGQMLISHGYTRLEMGDLVTLVGSINSLEEVSLRFDVHEESALQHLVERFKPKELAVPSPVRDLKKVPVEKKLTPKERFARYVEESIVLDIEHSITAKELFKLAADLLSPGLKTDAKKIFGLFVEREKECCTAIIRGVAIPHIIIDGENKFSMLIARSKEGIIFSDAAPKVYAVFMLLGTRDERDFHLQALKGIAESVQSSHFENRWLRARNEKALRHVILDPRP